MKRTLALILALAMALTLASCSRGGADADTDAGTDADTASGMTEADAKRILEEFFTPTPTDDVVEDDFYYDSYWSSGRTVRLFNAIIGDNNIRYMVDMEGKTEPVLACTVDGCTHDDVRCLSFDKTALLVVETEDGELVAYTTPTTNRAGTFKLGDYNVNADNPDKSVLLEYNITKGTVRCVSTELEESLFCAYYNGFLYTNVRHLEPIYDENGWEEIGMQPVMNVNCIDVRTGKITSLTENGEKISALVCGVYENRVYCLRDGGDLISCSPDLTEYEIVANIGEDYMIPQSASASEHGLIWGDQLILLKKDPDTPDGERGVQTQDFDLYQIDLTDKDYTPQLILHDVRRINKDYSHIYYFTYAENSDGSKCFIYDAEEKISTPIDGEPPIPSGAPDNWTPTL